MIQLIASDIDGTLLNNKMQISKFNAYAIKKAQQQGVHFIISSGRLYSEVKPLLDEVGLKCPLISINGGLILSADNEVLAPYPLHQATVNKLMKCLKKHHLYFEVITKKTFFQMIKLNELKTLHSY